MAVERRGGDYVAASLVDAAANLMELGRRVADHRGEFVALPAPCGYELCVGPQEDTILTPRDIDLWRALPPMSGSLCVIGTVGLAGSWIWDRTTVAVGGDSRVYSFEMRRDHYVVRVADDLGRFFAEGLSGEFFHSLQLIDGDPAAVLPPRRRSERLRPQRAAAAPNGRVMAIPNTCRLRRSAAIEEDEAETMLRGKCIF